MDRYVAVGVLAILLGSTGCNQSSQPGENPTSSISNPDAPGAAPQPTSTLGATPEKAVAEFLEAIRSGNDETASLLLTPLAVKKTSEHNLTIAPAGSPTATFTVGKVEYVTQNKDGAHVLSSWTDVNGEEGKRTDNTVWVLRKEPNGWRIVGYVMKVFPDKDPLVLNFEDPEDMQRKLKMVYEEAAKAETQQPAPNNNQPQAQAPGVTPPAIR